MHFSTIVSNLNDPKREICLSHDLTERGIERQKTMCKILLQRHKRKHLSIVLLLVTKNRLPTIILKNESMGTSILWDPQTVGYYYWWSLQTTNRCLRWISERKTDRIYMKEQHRDFAVWQHKATRLVNNSGNPKSS